MHQEIMQLDNYSAQPGAGEQKGRLIGLRVSGAKGCMRHYRNLTQAYADLAEPGHRLIYATPSRNAPHPCALINRSNYVVCPTCLEAFHSTVDLCKHWGLEGRLARLHFKTFIGND